MIGLIIAVVLALGVGGGVQVADNARPGETLFGVDQAVENLQLKLAGEEKEARPRVKFAQARLEEIKEIVEEKKGEAATEESVEVDGEAEVKAEVEVSAEKQAEIKVGVEAALNLLSGLKSEE